MDTPVADGFFGSGCRFKAGHYSQLQRKIRQFAGGFELKSLFSLLGLTIIACLWPF